MIQPLTLPRGKRLTPAQDRVLARRYRDGETIRALSASTGRSYGGVHLALQRAGVSFRKPGGNTHRQPYRTC